MRKEEIDLNIQYLKEYFINLPNQEFVIKIIDDFNNFIISFEENINYNNKNFMLEKVNEYTDNLKCKYIGDENEISIYFIAEKLPEVVNNVFYLDENIIKS